MPAIRITKDTPRLRIVIDAEDEDVSPEESYLMPGVKELDADGERFVAAVEEMRDEHGEWGWCQVTVTVSLGPLEGYAYMGGCSYESSTDFEQNSGYFDQMVNEAIAELQANVDRVYQLIHVD
jgi:hypothetical protein